jgi:hypothetical protein
MKTAPDWTGWPAPPPAHMVKLMPGPIVTQRITYRCDRCVTTVETRQPDILL